MKPVTSLVLIVLLIASMGAGFGCGSQAGQTVAMVFDDSGLKNDFNRRCFDGAKMAETELGIEAKYVLARAPSRFEEWQRRYAEDGDHALIICVGSPQADALTAVAKDFPQQEFALVDGTIASTPNVACLVFRDNESSFLAGALAAMVTQTGHIGFVGGMDIPAIHRFLAGYLAGARCIDPQCLIAVSYAGSWADPETARALALAQYDSGADIVFGVAGYSTLGVFEAAGERDLLAIGVDTDQRHYAPDNVLVSVLKNLDTAVFNIVKDAVEGDFMPGIHSLGLKEDGVGLSLDNALPVVTAAMKQTIVELSGKIISGEIEVPSQG